MHLFVVDPPPSPYAAAVDGYIGDGGIDIYSDCSSDTNNAIISCRRKKLQP